MKLASGIPFWVVVSLCVACGSSTDAGSGGTAGSSGSSGANNVAGGGQGTAGSSGASGGSLATAGSSGSVTMGGAGASMGGGGSGGALATAGSGGANAGAGGTDPIPEGVPAGYQLVYSQTFAEAASLGDLVFGNPTQWKHDPAGFIASTGTSYMPPYRSPFSVAIIESIKVTSFVMDAEMLQTSPDGDAHRDMVLIWNFVNPSQFYYAHISTAHDGVAHNIHIVNNADRKAISTQFTAGYDWGRDVWKKLRVVRDVATGSMTIFDLDAPTTPILTASDKTFTDGYLGFGSFDNTGQVRNVKVWAAASTPGNPDFFEPAK